MGTWDKHEYKKQELSKIYIKEYLTIEYIDTIKKFWDWYSINKKSLVKSNKLLSQHQQAVKMKMYDEFNIQFQTIWSILANYLSFKKTKKVDEREDMDLLVDSLFHIKDLQQIKRIVFSVNTVIFKEIFPMSDIYTSNLDIKNLIKEVREKNEKK